MQVEKMKKLFIVFLFLAAVFPLFSFQFEPITQDFTPSGTNSRRSFIAVNPGDSPIPVKISMVHRDMDIYGKETLTSADNLFFVFPSQFVLPASSSQTVRVQWRDPSPVQIELPFRIIAQQLPIAMEEAQSGVTILLTYQGSVYVTPAEFRYGITVNSVKKGTFPDGSDALVIQLENTGNTHMLMNNPVVTLTQTTASGSRLRLELTGDSLTGLNDQNILAGKQRIFTVPWPEGLESGDLDATISLTPKR
jgi:fimbrial chaperone protein